jgi:hypothetical protein
MMSERMPVEEWRKLIEKLAQPFETMDFLPRAASGGKALALPYIDARDVQRRLNSVCGADWSFDFDLLGADGKMVKGILTVCGVTRCDAGEAAQEDEPLKSAVSDALKRAAVHFGIGQYLYHLPRVWAPYDPQKRRWVDDPQIERRVIDRAVALVIGNTLGEPAPFVPAPLASREEAAANRQEPPVDSAGDRAATQRPPVAQQARQQASAPTQAAPEARPPRQPVTESSVGNLHCSRPECGKPITRGQHDVSVRSYGAGYCPACQKLQASTSAEEAAQSLPAPTREKSPLDTARDGYFAAFSEKFGKVSNEQRYAIEGVLIGWKRPMRTGEKESWDVQKFHAAAKRARECNKDDVLRAAEDLVNVSRSLPLDPGANAAQRGGDNYRPSMAH